MFEFVVESGKKKTQIWQLCSVFFFLYFFPPQKSGFIAETVKEANLLRAERTVVRLREILPSTFNVYLNWVFMNQLSINDIFAGNTV